MELETTGIVIREYIQKERDKLLIVLTPDLGKIAVWASGAKNTRSRLLSASQLMAYSKMRLRERDGKYSLISAHDTNMFFELRQDIDRLALAQYFCDLADTAFADGLEAGELISLLLNSLYMLCRENSDTTIVKSVFELRFMSVIGFTPITDACFICGEHSGEMLFSFEDGAVICRRCGYEKDIKSVYPVNEGALLSMKHIISADAKKIFSFRTDDDTKTILSRITEGFLCTQLGIHPRTLEFYNSL